jgi:hypothetical protein
VKAAQKRREDAIVVWNCLVGAIDEVNYRKARAWKGWSVVLFGAAFSAIIFLAYISPQLIGVGAPNKLVFTLGSTFACLTVFALAITIGLAIAIWPALKDLARKKESVREHVHALVQLKLALDGKVCDCLELKDGRLICDPEIVFPRRGRPEQAITGIPWELRHVPSGTCTPICLGIVGDPNRTQIRVTSYARDGVDLLRLFLFWQEHTPWILHVRKAVSDALLQLECSDLNLNREDDHLTFEQAIRIALEEGPLYADSPLRPEVTVQLYYKQAQLA